MKFKTEPIVSRDRIITTTVLVPTETPDGKTGLLRKGVDPAVLERSK